VIVVLIGASGSGKSTIEKELVKHHKFSKIVSCTTRKHRDGEENGRDYYFISNARFSKMLEEGQFAEYDEYSQNRFYGTLKRDYVSNKLNRVVVLTPNGFRQLKKNCPNEKIFSVLVNSNLGTRIKRYIDRCGVDKFNYDDKNEIMSRVERDFGMFLGLEKEVDLVINNNEGTDIKELAKEVLDKAYGRE
jgi:guanylate kinase